MNISMKPRLAACAALTAFCVPALALAEPGGIRLQVGDLSTPEAVKAFDQRLNVAARDFCSQGVAHHDLSALRTCENTVREEVMEKLTPAQRQAYKAATRAQASL